MKNQISVIIVVGLLIASIGAVINLSTTSPPPASAVAAQIDISKIDTSSHNTDQPDNVLVVTKNDFEHALDTNPKKTDPYQFVKAVPQGKPAPDFTVKTAAGDTLKLSEFKGKKNVVLIFYQGHFCAICGKQLNNIQFHIQDFRNQDAEIIAISADDIKHAQLTLGERGLSFHVVPDPNKDLIALYGVKNTSKNIAWPSAFVIDKKGTVILSYASEDGHRLHSSDFLPVLSKITGKPAPVLTYYE